MAENGEIISCEPFICHERGSRLTLSGETLDVAYMDLRKRFGSVLQGRQQDYFERLIRMSVRGWRADLSMRFKIQELGDGRVQYLRYIASPGSDGFRPGYAWATEVIQRRDLGHG